MEDYIKIIIDTLSNIITLNVVTVERLQTQHRLLHVVVLVVVVDVDVLVVIVLVHMLEGKYIVFVADVPLEPALLMLLL